MIAQPHCIMEPCQMPGLAGSFLLCSVAVSIAHCSHLHSGEGCQERGGKNHVLDSSCSFSTYIQSVTRAPTLTLLWMFSLHSHKIESSHFPSSASMPTQFLLPLCGISETTSKWHPGFCFLHPLIYPKNHCWAYLPKTPGFHINLLLSNLE